LKWDKSIHANLSAETVPTAESRANIGFATGRAMIDQPGRTKSMRENGAAHPSSAPVFVTLTAYSFKEQRHAERKILRRDVIQTE
jgi:hypothetical protein